MFICTYVCVYVCAGIGIGRGAIDINTWVSFR